MVNLTYIVTVGTGKQLVAIYNVSFGRQILNWTVRDGHYIWRPTVSLYQLLLC